jgi:hypothetical protein
VTPILEVTDSPHHPFQFAAFHRLFLAPPAAGCGWPQLRVADLPPPSQKLPICRLVLSILAIDLRAVGGARGSAGAKRA